MVAVDLPSAAGSLLSSPAPPRVDLGAGSWRLSHSTSWVTRLRSLSGTRAGRSWNKQAAGSGCKEAQDCVSPSTHPSSPRAAQGLPLKPPGWSNGVQGSPVAWDMHGPGGWQRLGPCVLAWPHPYGGVRCGETGAKTCSGQVGGRGRDPRGWSRLVNVPGKGGTWGFSPGGSGGSEAGCSREGQAWAAAATPPSSRFAH